MTRLAVSAAFAAALLAAAPVLAQSGLMDVGKSLLKQEVESRGGLGTSSSSSPSSASLGSSLSSGEIGSGLKEALKVAADKVTGQLGKSDGFNADPAVHIPLPGSLEKVRQGLALAGKSGLVDDLELKLNRAAEAATPKARQIFFDAVQKMTLDDARAILNGPSDAATQYFKTAMTPDLKAAMRPVVDSTVAQSGAVQSYKSVTGAAGSLPLVGNAVQSGPDMLTDHVLGKALDGIFHYLGQEEADIRANPAKRTTQLLRKVFGG